MTEFKEIHPTHITDNAIKIIGKDWMLITAGTMSKFNMMTASWGGIGNLWRGPVAFAFVRPQRFTFPLMEQNAHFTLTFYDDGWRDMLNFCGTKSGRDVDKVAATGLTPVEGDDRCRLLRGSAAGAGMSQSLRPGPQRRKLRRPGIRQPVLRREGLPQTLRRRNRTVPDETDRQHAHDSSAQDSSVTHRRHIPPISRTAHRRHRNNVRGQDHDGAQPGPAVRHPPRRTGRAALGAKLDDRHRRSVPRIRFGRPHRRCVGRRRQLQQNARHRVGRAPTPSSGWIIPSPSSTRD